MPLQNSQLEMAEAILSDYALDDVIPVQNIRVYQNNVMSNLTHALQNTYPLIVRLLGDDFFSVAAKEYINQYPSCSGNLNDYGEYFSDFIAAYPPVKNLIYLAEVAQFEWVSHSLFFAADHAPLDTSLLEKLDQQQYGQIHFILHPASHVMKFHYPILRIIELCKGEIDETLNIGEGGVLLLIIRRDLEIMLKELSLSEYTFLSAIQSGKNLSQALNEAAQVDANFKLDENLPAWIQDKTIIDCYLEK